MQKLSHNNKQILQTESDNMQIGHRQVAQMEIVSGTRSFASITQHATHRRAKQEHKPGMIRSEAMYVREIAAPPSFMRGPNRCTMET